MREVDKETGVRRVKNHERISNRKNQDASKRLCWSRVRQVGSVCSQIASRPMGAIIWTKCLGVLEKSLALAPSLQIVLPNALAIIPSVKVTAVQHQVAVVPFNRICKPHNPELLHRVDGFWNGQRWKEKGRQRKQFAEGKSYLRGIMQE